MVPGIPIIGKLNSLLKINPPVKVPSPPIKTNASMPSFIKFEWAFFLPSLVLNSAERADFKTVPPV